MAEESVNKIEPGLSRNNVFLMAIAVTGLALVFLFQRTDVLDLLCSQCSFHPYTHFVVKKFLRVLLNDTFMLLFIHALFRDPSVTKLAWYIQLVDTLVLLPAYLILKLTYEGDAEISIPLLSQFHRLIVNPTLMVLLIPAVYYHRRSNQQNSKSSHG
jgi:exosortase F-associated protein